MRESSDSKKLSTPLKGLADMYRNFYQLECAPFALPPIPDPLFLSARHQRTFEELLESLDRKTGIIALTGQTGLGKTTLLRVILAQHRREKSRTIFVESSSIAFNSNTYFKGILKSICNSYSYQIGPSSPQNLLEPIHELFIEDYKNNLDVIIVIDDAHCLPVETLKQLPSLIEIYPYREQIAQLILCGQPPLESLLRDPKMQGLNAPIHLLPALDPLTKKESVSYLHTRLEAASKTGEPVFSKRATNAIAAYAQGLPRTLNMLGTEVLQAGFQDDKKPISARIVKRVINELKNQPEPSRLFRLARLGAAVAVVVALVWSLSPTGPFEVSPIRIKAQAAWRYLTSLSPSFQRDPMVDKPVPVATDSAPAPFVAAPVKPIAAAPTPPADRSLTPLLQPAIPDVEPKLDPLLPSPSPPLLKPPPETQPAPHSEWTQRVVDLMRQHFPNGGAFPLRVWVNKGPEEVYTEGENLLVHVLSDHSAYLQMDYYQADGQVVHLLPHSLDSNWVDAGKMFSLGKPDNALQFAVAPPFGIEMLTVVASQSRVETQPGAPQIEPAAQYLERFAKRLEAYKAQGNAAIAHIRIRTRPTQ